MPTTSETVRRLWALCSILRDEGVTYHEYLTELTYVLFLKLASELGIEDHLEPEHRWKNMLSRAGSQDVLERYQALLDELGRSDEPLVRTIFAAATTRLRTADGLSTLLRSVDGISWSENGTVELGDVYEGLIEKSAQEARYGAGQYFTPRAIVESIVAVLAPGPRDTVYDPAAGTAGFLVAAGQRAQTPRGKPKLFDVELSADVHRLGAANLALHQLDATFVLGDALRGDYPPDECSVCVTNPPFGVKGSLAAGEAAGLDFKTSNKQLAFVQHVYSRLAKGGRAAIIVPDNVLFEDGVARSVRARLMDDFVLHTILRLPTGIFYATGVKTSVLFFSSPKGKRSTDRVWFFNLRDGQRGDLTARDLRAFERAYGADPNGLARRRQSRRFSALTREEIAARNERLDVGSSGELAFGDEPGAIGPQLALIRAELDGVAQTLEALDALLAGEDSA